MKIRELESNRFSYLIRKKQNIALFGHKKPDADTIGSILALRLALEPMGKKVTCFTPDEPPEYLHFLSGCEEIQKTEDCKPADFDLVIAVDCGDFSQTGLSAEQKASLPVSVNIDHHGGQTFADLNIIESSVSSAAEVVYFLLREISAKITQEIATCLICGIIQDTDHFKNPNTTKETYRTTSKLLEKGVNLKKITANLNTNKSATSLKMWGKILERARKHPQLGVVTTYITHDEIAQSGAKKEDIEGVANFLNSMPEAKAACILTEFNKGEIKGSLRTMCKKTDVSKLASYFGGGGHKKAAGFILRGTLKKDGDRVSIINA